MDQDARIAVLESRLERMEADAACQGDRITRLEQAVAGLKTDIAVLATRIGMYATIGAFLGGALVNLLPRFLHLP